MNNSKKIALFLGAIATGGAERVACTLAEEWIKQGIEVHLITLYPPYETAYPIDEKVKQHYLFPGRSNNKIKTFFGSIFHLRKIVKEIRPDAVLSLIIRYNLLALLALQRTGVRLVVSDRDNPYFSHGFFQDFMRRVLYRFSAGIVAQTELAREVAKKISGHKNIAVIPNPLNHHLLAMEPHEFGTSCRIITVGRMIPSKNHAMLIEAFSRIADRYPLWTLVFAGDGPEYKKLTFMAKEKKLDDRIVFMGNCKNVFEALQNSEVFAFTSNSEGYPNVLCEAMGMGLCCISTNCPAGPDDLIKDGENGFLSPMNEIEPFVQKLEMLISDKELRKCISQNALEIREKLDPTVVSKQYLDFLLYDIPAELW